MKRVAPLNYAVIFKKAFGKPAIFTAFVKAVLGINIEIDKVETEKAFPLTIDKVESHYDLFAEDTKNRLVINIQQYHSADAYHRFLYYHLMTIAEQAAKTANNRPGVTVLTIVVLTGADKHQLDMSVFDMDPKTSDGQALGEILHKLIFLAPRYVSDDTPEPLREWLRAIADTLDEQVDETSYSDRQIQQVFSEIDPNLISTTEHTLMFEENAQEELPQA